MTSWLLLGVRVTWAEADPSARRALTNQRTALHTRQSTSAASPPPPQTCKFSAAKIKRSFSIVTFRVMLVFCCWFNNFALFACGSCDGIRGSHFCTVQPEQREFVLLTQLSHSRNLFSCSHALKPKVHAQRKFAQGSRPGSPNISPSKKTPKKFFTTKKAKTEDFLTFLCLRSKCAKLFRCSVSVLRLVRGVASLVAAHQNIKSTLLLAA